MNEAYFEAEEQTSFEMLAAEQEEQQPLEMHSDMKGIIRDYDVLKNIPCVNGIPIHGDITRSGKYTDEIPKKGSKKLLTSGAAKKALDAIVVPKKLSELLNDMFFVTISVLESKLTEKQDKLIIDPVPSEDSDNPVSSGGVYGALQDTSVEFLTNMEIEELFKNFSKGV